MRTKILDVLIIGTGAIGGYYGSRLAHGGHDVHFLLNSDYEYVKEHGLTVDSHFGDFSLPKPNVYSNIKDMPPCDLVCIAVKATANDNVFPHLTNVLKKDSAILLLQNGFGYEQQLAEIYPDHPIIGGLCFISSFRDGPGTIRHTDYGKITLTILQEKYLSVLKDVANVFSNAGIETETKANLVEARIRKLMWNIPYNGMSVIANCKTDTLSSDPAMRELTRAIMDELLEAAEACGTPIEAAFADEMVKLTDLMSAYSPSMRLDFLAGRPMEIDAIYSNFIRYASEHGYEMRFAKMIKWQLEYLQTQNETPNLK